MVVIFQIGLNSKALKFLITVVEVPPMPIGRILSLSLFPAKAQLRQKQLSYLTHILETKPFFTSRAAQLKRLGAIATRQEGDEPYVDQMESSTRREDFFSHPYVGEREGIRRAKVPNQRTSSATSVRYEIERYGFVPTVKPLMIVHSWGETTATG